MKTYVCRFPMVTAAVFAAPHFAKATPTAKPASRRPDSAGCKAARKRARTSAADLAAQAQRLRQCALKEDTNDDCAAEYRGLRTAYDEYRNTVLQVHSHCD